jgi:membrane protein
VVRSIVRHVQGLRVHNAGDAAPAMAFHFFLSMIPVLVLAGFILGQLVRRNGVEALLGPVLDSAPDAAEQIVRRELERLAGHSVAPLAPLSVLGFLWLASSGTQGLMDVFEVAVGAPRRSWWKQRAIALAWVLCVLLAMSALAWGMVRADRYIHKGDAPVPSALARARGNAGDAPPTGASSAARHPTTRAAEPTEPPPTARSVARRRIAPLLMHAPWERAVGLAALFALSLGGLATFYRVAVEHPAGVRRRAWPGAFVAFIAWVLISWIFGVYVASLASYALFYGSVAAVAVLLVWFYLTSWSLLLGAEVNAQLEGLRDTRSPSPPRRTRATA